MRIPACQAFWIKSRASGVFELHSNMAVGTEGAILAVSAIVAVLAEEKRKEEEKKKEDEKKNSERERQRRKRKRRGREKRLLSWLLTSLGATSWRRVVPRPPRRRPRQVRVTDCEAGLMFLTAPTVRHSATIISRSATDAAAELSD